ncbi:uncharacterized protein LTR77_008038 [Saxophila tyrrhenica]|uniref:Xylanolytic transcriptional activator regulatory domain-containing protein n=1 Tax=Saxophila tyrrhenica TaxID=1690608 RepID=A0AAV9P3L3_9PEZI|nr:hypothetical protein LTR77_008038 [Saxophila tyrrhenica]
MSNPTSNSPHSYFTTHHPLFPILPSKAHFYTTHTTNRLLLWTVLALASFDQDSNSATYFSLVDPVRRLAADLYGPQSRSFKTMQALLLLCVWPFPFQQTINDPSPMFCSLATGIGYQLGLHRPRCRGDFDENAVEGVESEGEEERTWWGCFVVNHCLALRLGVPSTISPAHALLSAASSDHPSAPPSLLIDLNLALLSKQYTTLLGDDPSTPSGQRPDPGSLIHAFESQLAQLRSRFSGHWTAVAEISYYALQLQVYSFSLCQSADHLTSDENNNNNTAAAQLIQAKALSAVVKLVSEASKPDPDKKFWPAATKYCLVFAACIGVSVAADSSDLIVQISLLSAVKDAVVALRGWSLFPRDQIARVAGHLSTAAARVEGGTAGAGKGKGKVKEVVRARMTANIPYRVIWGAKHGRALSSRPNGVEGHVPQVSTGEAMPAPETGGYTPQQPIGMDAFEDVDDANFTDIFLDWQQLLDLG